MGMNTQHLIRLVGSAKAVSELFGITQSAVSQWGETVPTLRLYQLRDLRPDLKVELPPVQEKEAA